MSENAAPPPDNPKDANPALAEAAAELDLGGLDEPRPSAPPPPVPAAEAELAERIAAAEERLSNCIRMADEAVQDYRWLDADRWLGDARSALVARRRLVDELRLAQRMRENFD